MFDVLHLRAVGASVVGLLATELSAHWESMAGEQPHETFDFGVGNYKANEEDNKHKI
jgi:hypothetical protein